MFRVFLSTSRAAQRRSQRVLHCTRSFSHIARLAADGAKNVTTSNISADVPGTSAIKPPAITEEGVTGSSINLVGVSHDGIQPVPLADAVNEASNSKARAHAKAEETGAAIKKIMAEKRAAARKLPMGTGLDLSEEDKSLLWYLETDERRKRASEMIDEKGRVRPEFEYLQQFHKTFLRELEKALTTSTRLRKDFTPVEKAEKRARALMLPKGDGLSLSDDDKLLLFFLTAKEKLERGSGVFGSYGLPHPQFEHLRKIHMARKPRRGLTSQISDDISEDAVKARRETALPRNPKPIFPPGPEQVKSIERWEKVINCLITGFRRGRQQTGGRDIKRLNIIGESLCDDILERLKPTLQKHIGCDIVDINPGAGIWSSKIHDFLKPRTHILLEPDTVLYEPLLKPLLDAPDSKYTLIPKSGIVWGHLEKVMSPEYLPFQEAFDKQDPRLNQPNNTLLLIANLGNYPKKPYAGFPSLASLVLYQFLSAVQTHSLIQRYGLVRMLIWIPDDERNSVLPRSISWRRKSSIDASISYENVVEVASSTRDLRNSSRERHIDADVARKVFRKMKDAGFKTPPGRESLLLEELSGDERDHNLKKKLENSKYGKELAELAVTADESDESNPAITPETLRRIGRLRAMQRLLEKRAVRFTNLTDDYDAIMELQKTVYNSNDETEIASLKDDLDKRTNDWTETITDLNSEYRTTIQQMIDNRLAVNTNPPTLRTDRREYEPLRVHPADFYPAVEMCLLDFQPRPLWPVLRENLQENLEIYSYIVGHLYILPTQSIRRGFNALAPGAFEWLIAECPSITNPNKGGSLDLDVMTVRRLTDEMIKEMVEAWVRWPFRPTRYELMARSGAGVFDPDELETDGTDASE